MSGLSSRVMNMKFMRGGEAKQETDDAVKVKDNSEWHLKDSNKILAGNQPRIVASVGYGNINSFDSDSDQDEVVPTRRTWGEPEKTQDAEDINAEDSKSLDSVSLKDSKKTKKTKKTKKNNKGSLEEQKESVEVLEPIKVPESIGELNTEEFLNTVFKQKKRSKLPEPSQVKKRRRLP